MAATQKPIALVTGANRGIGLEIARTLARDHGFHVVIGTRNVTAFNDQLLQLQNEEKLSVEAVALDLSSDASIADAVSTLEKSHGKLDVLVNNAGVYYELYQGYPALADVRKTFQQTFETNVFGSAVVTESFVPLLEKSKVPRVVFISSILSSIQLRIDPKSSIAAWDGYVYGASKAAVNNIVAAYVKRFGAKGWKFNAACPGSVATGMNGFQGAKPPSAAMPNIMRLCTLGEDGVTGTFSDEGGAIPW